MQSTVPLHLIRHRESVQIPKKSRNGRSGIRGRRNSETIWNSISTLSLFSFSLFPIYITPISYYPTWSPSQHLNRSL